MVAIEHSAGSVLAAQKHVVRFSRIAFDSAGAAFAAVDQQGNIFTFRIHDNKCGGGVTPSLTHHGRFSLVHRTGAACTALAFMQQQTTELLVACADNTLKCFDTGAIASSTCHVTGVRERAADGRAGSRSRITHLRAPQQRFGHHHVRCVSVCVGVVV